MSQALRIATEPALRTMPTWHPAYDSSTPRCLQEFLEWSRCVKKGHHCTQPLKDLKECIERYSALTEGAPPTTTTT